MPVRPENSLAILAISGTSPSVDDRPEKSLAIRAKNGHVALLIRQGWAKVL
jgi:hypothetical protein